METETGLKFKAGERVRTNLTSGWHSLPIHNITGTIVEPIKRESVWVVYGFEPDDHSIKWEAEWGTAWEFGEQVLIKDGSVLDEFQEAVLKWRKILG